MIMELVAVDLFCGAGGLTAGLEAAGITVRAGFDLDGSCEWSYRRNTGAEFVSADVEKLSTKDVLRHFDVSKDRLTLLAGCAPCQPFSTYGRTRSKKDDKWRLLRAFARLVVNTRPDLVTMENVPGLSKHRIFHDFLNALKGEGYDIKWKVLDCTRFGVPQSRERLVLVASKVGAAILPEPTCGNPLTVRDAISHLPPIEAGETHPDDPIHKAASLSPLNLERIRASKPGGSWRDWPPHLISLCHRKEKGWTYPSVYGRMEWDAPSPTITTQCYGYGNGRFGHPEQDRAISLREAALLQSFPEDWEFVEPGGKVEFAPIGRHIGNAVPPRLGEAIGKALLKSVGLNIPEVAA